MARPSVYRQVTGAVVVAAVVGAGAAVAAMVVFGRSLDTAGRGDMAPLNLGNLTMFTGGFSALVVGAALAVRRPRHPVGWLFLGLGVTVPAVGAATAYAAYGLVAEPPEPPATDLMAVLADAGFVVWLVLIGLVLYLTPTGRPLAGWWRWPALALVVGGVLFLVAKLLLPDAIDPPLDAAANPLAVEAMAGALKPVRVLSVIMVGAGVVLGGVSLLVRAHRSSGAERRRLMWMALVAVPLPGLVVVAYIAAYTGDLPVMNLAAAVLIALIPVAAGLSIVRYHLYDVDRILGRVLSYVLLSALVAVTYAVVVVSVGRSLGDFGGRSQFSAVVATLAAVTVAAPARRRLQDTIDQRFNRRRFEALKVVERFVRDPDPGVTIEDVLRRAVGEPALRVAYRVEDRWVTGDGHPVVPGDEEVTVHRLGRVVATIAAGPDRADRSLVEAAAGQATPELDNAGLRAAIALQLVEVQQSRARIVAAQAKERRRIERNLHDGAQQRLLAIALRLRAARLNGEGCRMRGALDEGVTEIQTAVLELRELANGLHPTLLGDGGLIAAIDDLAARTPVAVEARVLDRRLPEAVESAAWFIVCEALTNAVKHAGAELITIDAGVEEGRLIIVVDDDGAGGADPAGPGLRGIADRAEACGGSLTVARGPGRGTRVRAELPCAS